MSDEENPAPESSENESAETESAETESAETESSSNGGFKIAGCGCLIALAPPILGGLAIQLACGGNANESSCGASGVLFLTPLSFTVGAIITVIGFLIGVFGGGKKS